MENSLFYFLALKQHNASGSELHIFPSQDNPYGRHGYGRCTVCVPCRGVSEVCTWPDRGALFLQTLGMAPEKPPPRTTMAAAVG